MIARGLVVIAGWRLFRSVKNMLYDMSNMVYDILSVLIKCGRLIYCKVCHAFVKYRNVSLMQINLFALRVYDMLLV